MGHPLLDPRRIRCSICGDAVDQHPPFSRRSRTLKCEPCGLRFFAARYRAHMAVARAIRCGELAPVNGKACVDCGQPAVDYDHRDYAFPLQVEPTCRSCNLRRGQAALSSHAVPLVAHGQTHKRKHAESRPLFGFLCAGISGNSPMGPGR